MPWCAWREVSLTPSATSPCCSSAALRCAAGRALGAFITLEPDQVLEEARACEQARRAGHRLGPLFGLPIPVKDSVNTRDYSTTAGTPALRHFRPAEDASVVKALRVAGAYPAKRRYCVI